MATLVIFIFFVAILFVIVYISSFLKEVVRLFSRLDQNKRSSGKNNSTVKNYSPETKKIFGNHEGKYVSYEELKD